jgi:hypothetical protein
MKEVYRYQIPMVRIKKDHHGDGDDDDDDDDGDGDNEYEVLAGSSRILCILLHVSGWEK